MQDLMPTASRWPLRSHLQPRRAAPRPPHRSCAACTVPFARWRGVPPLPPPPISPLPPPPRLLPPALASTPRPPRCEADASRSGRPPHAPRLRSPPRPPPRCAAGQPPSASPRRRPPPPSPPSGREPSRAAAPSPRANHPSVGPPHRRVAVRAMYSRPRSFFLVSSSSIKWVASSSFSPAVERKTSRTSS